MGPSLRASGPLPTAPPGACDDGRMDEPTPIDGRFVRRTRQTAYENPWITVWHDDVIRPDGTPGIYGTVHLANLAVGVVAIDVDDRVVLVGQHRYVVDEFSWELPEGGVPEGETALTGAQRELHEETGVTATEWREIARLVLSNSVTDERAILFLATGLTHGEAEPEPSEALTVRWLPFDDVLAMTLDGRINDVMTVVGIERVALLRHMGGPGVGR
jgi:8-oxo-dGTP pyrophosphatase MutT (NUDIX family)